MNNIFNSYVCNEYIDKERLINIWSHWKAVGLNLNVVFYKNYKINLVLWSCKENQK
jgi:hypothetical protein